jgi:hypothetical protein
LVRQRFRHTITAGNGEAEYLQLGTGDHDTLTGGTGSGQTMTASGNDAEFGVQLGGDDTVNALGHNDIVNLAHGDVMMKETIDTAAHTITFKFSDTGQLVTIHDPNGVELHFSSGHVQELP